MVAVGASPGAPRLERGSKMTKDRDWEIVLCKGCGNYTFKGDIDFPPMSKGAILSPGMLLPPPACSACRRTTEPIGSIGK